MNLDQLSERLTALDEKESALMTKRKILRAEGIRTIQNIVDNLGISPGEIFWAATQPIMKSRPKTYTKKHPSSIS